MVPFPFPSRMNILYNDSELEEIYYNEQMEEEDPDTEEEYIS